MRAISAQPAVPPLHGFLQKTDRRSGYAVVRIDMRPRSDQTLPGHLQAIHQAEHGVRITVGPASDRKHRALDSGPVLAYRTMTPVVVTVRMLHPERGKERQGVESLEPRSTPFVPV